jgi:esterase
MSPAATDPDDPAFVYDEFSHFAENCAEYGLTAAEDVRVERVDHQLEDGRRITGLLWGAGTPELVLVHGGAQNAHTWDTVALALRPVPLLAVDLPGHGHSGWRTAGAYGPRQNAADLVPFLERYAPEAKVLAGMSLGGLTANALAARHPTPVRRLVAVDITPGVTRDKAADVHAFIEGPQRFESFGAILERTVEFNPTRSVESLRRGILHNAHRLPSGEWEWNYDRSRIEPDLEGESEGTDLWSDVASIDVPYLLVRGGLSPVVDDDDVAELMRLQPSARVVVVEGAGHSVQGDRPLELAEMLRAELDLAREPDQA